MSHTAILNRGPIVLSLLLLTAPVAVARAMQEPGAAGPADSTVAGNRGEARWSVPIEVPPGPGGFTPDVVLRYSSQRGDGPFGVGWDVPVSQIHCSTRHGVPAFVYAGAPACPRFELDGELLNHDAAGNRYHTFVESFQRIERIDTGGSVHWEVTSTDGVVRRYGTSANSRIHGPGGAAVRWLLAEVENPFGQKVLYTYDGAPQTPTPDAPLGGFTYLASIAYGPSHTEREVRFVYEPRLDEIHDYSGGVERHVAHRAREILVLSHGLQHSRWLLGYDLAELGATPAADTYTTARSRLSWIQRFGADCSASDPTHPTQGCAGLPAQEFVYSDPSDVAEPHWIDRNADGQGWNTPPLTIENFWWLPPLSSDSRFGDVNGDGRIDYVRASDGFVEVRLNTGSRWGAAGADAGLEAQEIDYEASLAALSFDAPGFHFTLTEGASAVHPVLCSATRVTAPAPVAFRGAGDVTGGAADLVARWEVSFDPGQIGEHGEPLPTSSTTRLLGNFHLVDVDGDGLADLVMSIRFGGIRPAQDCHGSPFPASLRDAMDVRVGFRNTGEGWVRDDELVRDLPALGYLAISDSTEPGISDEDGCSPLGGRMIVGSGIGDRVFKFGPCFNPVSFAPQFLDLNGDRRLDLIVAVPSRPDPWFVLNEVEGGQDPYSNTESVAWISTEEGWERAPQFDLPFHHAQWALDISYEATAGTIVGRLGLQWVDLNRDGYTDVLWKDPYASSPWAHSGSGYASEPVGVLLNRGGGTALRSSAWCSSRPLAPTWSSVAECSAESAAYRYELPEDAILDQFGPPPLGNSLAPLLPGPAEGHLADVNGDGWPDLSQGTDHLAQQGDPMVPLAWLFDPGGGQASAWRLQPADSAYFPPVAVGMLRTTPHNSSIHFANSATIDLDSDGVADWIRWTDFSGNEAFASRRPLPDLLSEIRTGTGGTLRIRYDTGPRLRDEALEDRAREHALATGETLGGLHSEAGSARWTTTPVVAAVEVEGPNRAPSTTTFRYADSRWCPEHRSGLGFRLVELTRPDASVRTRLYYQRHGRAGKLSQELVHAPDGRELRRRTESWVTVDPGSVTGAWAGDPATGSEASRLGRLFGRSRWHSYGPGQTGAIHFESLSYDDGYGYNFVDRIVTTRSSTTTTETRVPEPADESAWIIGLVESSWIGDPPGIRRVEREYTPQGRIWRRTVVQERRDGTLPESEPAITELVYDADGNVVARIDPNGNRTEFCYDGNDHGHGWCDNPPGPTNRSNSVLVGRRDPGVGEEPGKRTTIVPDPVFAVPLTVSSEYTDVPTTRSALDPFGRVVARFVTPNDGSEVQLSSIRYVDDVSPHGATHVVTLRYTEHGQADADAIRSVVFADGFGGTWKTVEQADVPSADAHMGTALFHRPGVAGGENETRETYLVPCADSLCSGLTGETEGPATVTRSDPLGRSLSTQTPDGLSLFHHSHAWEAVVGPSGVEEDRLVDVVMEQNARGHLTRRSFDGDRLLAVEECTNPEGAGTDLADEPCDGDLRTLYGHHPNGQLEVIQDPGGNQLRYHFDTAGRVIAISDPDAGESATFYDPAGNVTERHKVTATGELTESRTLVYDELDRLTGILTPPGEPNHFLGYRPSELQLGGESSSGFWKTLSYDGYGRLSARLHAYGSTRLILGEVFDLIGRRIQLSTSGMDEPYLFRYEGAYLKSICNGSVDEGCSSGAPMLIEDVVYDEIGRRKALALPGGTRTFGYDGDRRHLERDEFSATAGGSWFIDYGERDPLGNVESWETRSTLGGVDASALDGTGSYAYDHRDRLAFRSFSGQPDEHFVYDALGNLTGHGVGSAGEQNQFFEGPRPHAITARGSSNPVTYEYDDWGNLARRAGSVAPRYYTFDSANRLACVGSSAGGCQTLSVAYDAAGMRVAETAGGTRRYFVGHDLVLTREPSGDDEYRVELSAFGERVAFVTYRYEDAAAGGPPAAGHEPPFGLLLLVPLGALGIAIVCLRETRAVLAGSARRPALATTIGLLVTAVAIPFPVHGGGGGGPVRSQRWVISDTVGSGVAIVDESGHLVRQTRYEPFGGVDAETTPGTGDRRFYAGHPRQEDTDLVYMKARWMDPETGTFLSVDPLIVPDDPQSHTGYAYARNNPISATDPTGQLPVPLIVLGIGAVIGGVAGARSGNVAHGVKVGLFTAAAGLAVSAVSTTTGAAATLGVTPSTFRSGANALLGGGTEALNGGDMVSVTAATLSAGTSSKVSDMVEGGLTANSLGALFGGAGETTGAVAAVSPTIGAATGEAIGQGVNEVGEAVENFPEVPGSTPFPRPVTPETDSGPHPPAHGPQDFREVMHNLRGGQAASPPAAPESPEEQTATSSLP